MIFLNKIDEISISSPITYAWNGGVKLSQSPEFLAMCMNREEYEEEGVRGSYDRFDI